MVVIGRIGKQLACRTCYEKQRPTGVLCADCGKYPMIVTPAYDGRPRCRSCYYTMQQPCARCGALARAERHWPEGPVCLPCVDAVRLTHANCTRCGQLRPVFRRDGPGPVCPECAGVRLAYRCRSCGAMGRIHSRGLCPACRAQALLDQLFTAPDGRPRAEALLDRLFTAPDGRPADWLAPLAEELARYDNAYSLIGYLKGPGGRLIRKLATGELPCTHQALDKLRQTRSVEYLRSTLVLVGLLEPRDEELAMARTHLAAMLADVGHDEDRRLLARFLRWKLLPYLHERAEHDGTQNFNVRRYTVRQFSGARMFLKYLRQSNATLATCPQHLIDRWVGLHTWRRGDVRRFLAWAASQGLAPEHVAVSDGTYAEDRSITDDTQRVLLAIELQQNEDIPLQDRVAGCLVLQYGQHASRVSRLTITDIVEHPAEPGVLGLQLGADPLWLRPRLSQLLGRLAAERRSHAAAGRGRPTPYLFPGGRPGRPIAPDTLSRRLNALGISVRLARNGALLAMVGHVHWKVLADLLGVSDSAAQRWHAANGGDRASYIASRLKQQSPLSPA
jgi:hypothetical protein